MKIIFKCTAVLLIGVFFLVVSCEKDDSNRVPRDLKVYDFVWKGLNLYYYWQAEAPDLSDDRFENQTQLNAFMKNYNTPESFFEHLLVDRNTDRFSVIFNDYDVLQGILQGNTATTGMDFGLRRISPGSDEVFGWVRYVLPNSDAASKGVQRGQLFREINGISLRVSNESLWRAALAQNSFTLGFADYDDGNFVLNGGSVLLQKSQVAENPVYVSNVFQVNDKTIGYLMYNGFYSNFEGHLNQAFGEFAAAGVTDLVLDLRYNSGGSVATATRLASMITGQYTGQVFAKQEWNSKLMEYFNDTNPEQIVNRFTTTMNTGVALNSLFLDRLYVLTTSSSASASELLINGLKAYMGTNLVQIGTTTSGKNVGSVTLYDSPSFGTANKNPDHKYAMQPIVLKIVNKDDFGDYQDGLEPQVAFVEDYGDLGVLGTADEPFLAHALAVITGSDRSNRKHTKTFEAYKDMRSFRPFGQEMYIEEVPFVLQLPSFYEE